MKLAPAQWQSLSVLLDEAHKGIREAYFDEYRGHVSIPIYERGRLPVGHGTEGPAIIEQPDTTTVIYPQQTFYVDTVGNVIIKNTA